MFTKLLIKEWREKASLVFVGLIILSVFVPGYFALAGKQDMQEALTYALMLFFFPLVALLLGSAGFESEHRNDAWSFLLSRPISKAVVWAVKYLALLSMLAAVWLAFAATWLAVPGLKDHVGTTRVLFGFGMEAGFPWASLLVSVFLLTVAFALSMIFEKSFNTIFVALLLGGGALILVYGILRTTFKGTLVWAEPGKALFVFELAQVLMTLAVAGAAILTFIRADFSQPRKKGLRFSAWTAALLVPALLATAGWAFLGPAPQPRYVSFMTSIGGEPLFQSGTGIFKYSAKKDKIQWLTRVSSRDFFQGSGGGTKLVYSTYKVGTNGHVRQDFWSLDVATLKKRRIAGMGVGWQNMTSGIAFSAGIMSPDGNTIVLLAVRGDQPGAGAPAPLWLVNSDGSGLKRLPVDAKFVQGHEAGAWLHFLTFSPDGKAVYMEQIKNGKGGFTRLWCYDLVEQTSRILLNDYGWMPMGGSADFLTFRRRIQPGDKPALSLLDLRTLNIMDVGVGALNTFLPVAAWNGKGDKLAFVGGPTPGVEGAPYALAVYSVSEGKIVAEKTLSGFAENQALLSSPAWLDDDSRLVINYRSREFRILGPDLREQKTVAYPPAVGDTVQLRTAGHCVLVQDGSTDAIWRYDLRKDSWKRVY